MTENSNVPDPTPAAQLVTDSSKADEHFIREAAIAGLAVDALLGHDSYTAENALAWARSLMDEWEHAVHDGDCTGQPQTCIRCMCDEAMEQARKDHDE